MCIMYTHYRHVGQGDVLWTPPYADSVVGFEAGLVETRKGLPGTGGLKVSGSQESGSRVRGQGKIDKTQQYNQSGFILRQVNGSVTYWSQEPFLLPII